MNRKSKKIDNNATLVEQEPVIKIEYKIFL